MTWRPTPADLDAVFRLKYGDPADGWGPLLRRRFGHSSPDDWYEACIDRLVSEDTTWLDVGCGRNLFPSNRPMAQRLADRCRLLVGIDPDETLEENPFVHERVGGDISEYQTERKYDLVTLRMVAEHIVDAEKLVATLARLMAPAGRVVIYTVYKWSPVPIITRLTPFHWHHKVKKVLWRTEAKDTFPTAFRMNTRARLKELFGAEGFVEEGFEVLDDCRSFQRFRVLSCLELATLRMLGAVGIRYPERCLLGIYCKTDRENGK